MFRSSISDASTALDDNTGWPVRIAITVIIVAVAIAMRMLVERPVLAARDWLLPERQDRTIPGAAAAP